METLTHDDLEIFSTCPPSNREDRARYADHVADVARWSEEYGCRGILVYSDNSLLDPWLVAQIILANTKTLCPLVAVQPAYMHPYATAKMVASLGHLHGRRVYLNMVAGGFANDLTALGDSTPHDRRYDRLTEYTLVVKQLLSSTAPVTYHGDFYRVDRLRMSPPLPEGLSPGVLVSGSSAAGLASARALGATVVKYPRPAAGAAVDPPPTDLSSGVRIGIIAREDETDAWATARARFPEDRKGQLTHTLAMKTSDSVWHRQLSELGSATETGPYWLAPFQNYKTFCPYLVGSYRQVADELAAYLDAGYRTFILDVPPDHAELHHTRIAFHLALTEAR